MNSDFILSYDGYGYPVIRWERNKNIVGCGYVNPSAEEKFLCKILSECDTLYEYYYFFSNVREALLAKNLLEAKLKLFRNGMG